MPNNCYRLLDLWLFLCLAPMLTSSQFRANYLFEPWPSCNNEGWYKWPTALCRRLIGRSLRHNASLVPISSCTESLPEVMDKDNKAKQLYEAFLVLLTRYDCSQPYSIKFNCKDCQEVYKVWVCSTAMEYWLGIRRVKPCRSLCHAVEQKCPFFLPLDKSPAHYAGEPSFLCLDPYIEETEEQRMNSMYSDDCCYESCDQEPDRLCLKGSCSSNNSESSNRKTESLTALVSLSSSSLRIAADSWFLQLAALTNYLYFFKLSVT